MDLSDVEVRVLGCLVEKQLTTPQQYPLTLNALVLACNQASNRDPVVAYDEPTVDAAVTNAKTKGLASFVHPSHGRSALRYRHSLAEALGIAERPLALLAVLMLRGAQTPGELRARTERMVRFADVAEVEAELDALATREEPLVFRLRRAPGQKEDRYETALGPRRAGPAPPGPEPDASTPEPPSPPVPEAGPATRAPARTLQAEVDSLREDVAALRAEVESLRAALGG